MNASITKSRFHAWNGLFIASSLFLSSCAVQTDSRGNPQFRTDFAEVFGDKIATFTLKDGSSGTLRQLNGEYSIKLDSYFKMITLERAIMAKLAGTQTDGDRTMVLVETAERGCDYVYRMFSIKGRDVLSWRFGNCQKARVDTDNGELLAEFEENRRYKQYKVQDGRLVQGYVNKEGEGQLSASRHGSSSRLGALSNDEVRSQLEAQRIERNKRSKTDSAVLIPEGRPRYEPGPPIQVALTTNRSLDKPSPAPLPGESRTAETKQRERTTVAAAVPKAPPKPVKPLIFTEADEKPVRIVLDK